MGRVSQAAAAALGKYLNLKCIKALNAANHLVVQSCITHISAASFLAAVHVPDPAVGLNAYTHTCTG